MEQFQERWSRFWRLVIVLAAALGLVATALGGINFMALQEEPTARGASVPVYMEQGGEKMVVATGGAIEVQAGGNIQVTPGATVAIPNYISYGTNGQRQVCGTTTVTDTATASHGLTTPVYGWCTLNKKYAGDAVDCNAVTSGVTVTLYVYNSAATPAANSAGVSVTWCVIGTP